MLATLGTGVVVGVPSDVLPNPWFTREIDVDAFDVFTLAALSVPAQYAQVATPYATAPIRATMSWLVTRRDTGYPYESPQVIERLSEFAAAREPLTLSWGKEVPWSHMVSAARNALGTS